MNAVMPKIRDMAATDLPFVQPLLRQLGYELAFDDLERRFGFVMKSPDHSALMCETDGKLVGFIHLYGRPALEKPAEVIVQAVVIDAAYRNAGIGRALMMVAERWAMGQGYDSVALYTRADRDDARAFYSRLGYRAEATADFFRKSLR
jgi:ribosomal protein S18 acetylase RimI-like enzyme